MEKQKQENDVLLTINVKNEKGEMVAVSIPTNYKAECDKDTFQYNAMSYDALYRRVDSIYEIAALAETHQLDLIADSDCKNIYCEDYEEDENGDWREMSEEEMMRTILKCFGAYGCVYRYVACDYYHVGEKLVRISTEDYTLVKKGAEQFSAKYAVGTKAFYHKTSAEDLKASKIDSIIITHKAGYNAKTEYKMTDGALVPENSVLMRDKALEWVNTHG